jgi:hypothetical protein
VIAVRAGVSRHADWHGTARLVARELERHLPSPDVLTDEQRVGDPNTYRSPFFTPSPMGASRSSPSSGAPDR